MHKPLFSFLFAAGAMAIAAAPLAAAELDARYETIGTMHADLDGTRHELVIPRDTQSDSAFAERKMIMGSFLTINVVGFVVDDAGMPGRPMIQVTLQEQNGKMGLVSAELFDEQGYDAPMVMGADGGEGEVTRLSLERDAMEAEVSGTFLRLTGYMAGAPAPAEGATPVPVTIGWQVTLPPQE